MAHQRSRVPRAANLFVVLLPLLLCLPATADEPQKSLLERMDREMLRFRVQIQNGGMRLEQELIGPIGEELDPNEPATPWRTCCSGNLRKLRGAVREMTAVFDELERCHRAEKDYGSLSSLGFARTDLAEFSRVVEKLAAAPEKAAAQGILRGLTKVYFVLEESVEGIKACPAPEEAGAESEAQTEEGPNTAKPQKSK